MVRLLLLAVLALAAAAPAARAGDLVHNSASTPQVLSFVDDAGDSAAVTATFDAGPRTVTVTDTANPIANAPAFCSPAPPATTVTCTLPAASPEFRLDLFGNDGADSLTVNGPIRTQIDGGAGPDVIRGGSGIDWVFPRGGDDDVDGRDGGDLVYAAEDGSVNGADTYRDTGTTGSDSLTYFYMPDAAGVDITLDGVANDGNTTLDGGADDVREGFELLQGSEHDDDITGGPAAEQLSGAGGDDRLDGGGGADRFNGAEGDDTIDARDGGADTEINCDNSLGSQGTADVAALDADDPAPANCETVTRTGGGGGGTTGGGGGTTGGGGGSTGGGGGSPTGGGTVPAGGTAPGLPGAGSAPGRGVALVAAASTEQVAAMPGVVGRPIEAARRAVAATVTAMDLDVVFQKGCKASQDLEVLRQRPAKGARLDVAAGRPAPIRLTICVAERDFLADCDLKDLRGDLKELPKRMDADAGVAILDRFGKCKVDFDVKLAKQAEEARIALEAQKLRAAADKKKADEQAKRQKKGEIRSALTCPTAPDEQDLTMTLTEGAVADQRAYALRASGPGGWTIPAGRKSYVDVLVRDKGLPAHAVEATVYIDGDDTGMATTELGAPSQTAQATVARDGYLRMVLNPTRAGTIPICAVLRTGDGAMTAATAVKVVAEPGVGDVWTTISGRQLKTTKKGVEPVLATASGTAAHQNPITAVLDFLKGLFGGTSRSVAALPSGKEATVGGGPKLQSIQKQWAAAQVTLDGQLDPNPVPPQVADGQCLGWVKDAVLAMRCKQLQTVGGSALLGMSTTGGRIVALGAGTVLSHNGSQVVSRNGAGVVETNGVAVASSSQSNPGKGLMVAAGGLNAIGPAAGQLVGNDGASLIGLDGGTLIGNDGSTLIGNDGSTLIGNDGSTLVGTDGASLIGQDGASLRLAGPAGLVPPGALP